MTTFLLTISLLLNGISIYFIFILYSRQNRLLEIEKTQESFKKEIENEISAFLFEMKEENEEFIKRFQQMNNNNFETMGASTEVRKAQQNSEIPKKVILNSMDESGQKDWDAKVSGALKKQAVKVYQKTISDRVEILASTQEPEKQVENIGEQSEVGNEEIYRDLLINQVKLLQNQGLSIDEIAKRMNKGKTEIELLLKFSQN
jgi:hypothetical protein